MQDEPTLYSSGLHDTVKKICKIYENVLIVYFKLELLYFCSPQNITAYAQTNMSGKILELFACVSIYLQNFNGKMLILPTTNHVFKGWFTYEQCFMRSGSLGMGKFEKTVSFQGSIKHRHSIHYALDVYRVQQLSDQMACELKW